MKKFYTLLSIIAIFLTITACVPSPEKFAQLGKEHNFAPIMYAKKDTLKYELVDENFKPLELKVAKQQSVELTPKNYELKDGYIRIDYEQNQWIKLEDFEQEISEFYVEFAIEAEKSLITILSDSKPYTNNKKELVSKGEHTFIYNAKGFFEYKEQVNVDKNMKIERNLEPILGSVTFDVFPENTVILLDGKPYINGKKYTLEKKPYKVKLLATYYETKEYTSDLRALFQKNGKGNNLVFKESLELQKPLANGFITWDGNAQGAKASTNDIDKFAFEMLDAEYQKLLEPALIPPKPTQQKCEKPAVLTKNEFEKTSTFERRVSDEKIRVERLCEQYKREYEHNLKYYPKRVADIKEDHDENIQYHLKNRDLIYRKYVGIATNAIFKNPKVENIKYDADKELFSMRLFSQASKGKNKPLFDEEIIYPVRLEDAKKVKDILSDEKYIPTVILSVKDNKLSFESFKGLHAAQMERVIPMTPIELVTPIKPVNEVSPIIHEQKAEIQEIAEVVVKPEPKPEPKQSPKEYKKLNDLISFSMEDDTILLKTDLKLIKHFMTSTNKIVLDFKAGAHYPTSSVHFENGNVKKIVFGSHVEFYRVAIALDKTYKYLYNQKNDTITINIK